MTTRVLVDILDSHRRVHLRTRLDVASGQTFTIGRALDADVVIDDEHSAAQHATVEVDDSGRVLVSGSDTLNGIVLDGKHYKKAERVYAPGGQIQIGRTRLRVRTLHDAVAPEKLHDVRPASVLHDPVWLAGVSVVAGVMQVAYTCWLGAPRDLTAEIITALISTVLSACTWIALWSLLSRVLVGEWRWARHAAIAFGISAVAYLMVGLLQIAWFVFALPYWDNRAPWVMAVAICVALYLHLIYATHLTPRRAAIVAFVVPALCGGALLWVQMRQQTRNVNYIEAGLRIYPPALRATSGSNLDDYFKQAASLRASADAKRKATQADEDEPDAEASDDE